MKKLLLLAAVGLGLTGIACTSSRFVTVKLSNKDNQPVAYSLSYHSDIVEKSGMTGFTPNEYDIEVNPDGDNVTVTVSKTTIGDTNELRVELYYKGKVEKIESTTSLLWPIIITYEVN